MLEAMIVTAASTARRRPMMSARWRQEKRTHGHAGDARAENIAIGGLGDAPFFNDLRTGVSHYQHVHTIDDLQHETHGNCRELCNRKRFR